MRLRRIVAEPHDVVAGVSVALVVIPQSVAYAQLAGLPPSRGLYAAAVPPAAAAPFASSAYLQPGPSAVTSLLTFGALSPLAALGSTRYVQLALLLALLVGAVRVAVGVARAGVVAYLMSQPLLLGFVPAVAILVIASQLPLAVGAPKRGGNVLAAGARALVHPGAWTNAAVVATLASAAVLVLSPRVHRLLPGILLTAVGAIVYVRIFGYGAATIGHLPSGLPPVTTTLPWRSLPHLVVPAIVIALVGFAEASSIARTYAALDHSRWDAEREFVSQGVANVAAGLFGGFPVGASFSRSALNRLAGARTRASGLVTGVAVLLFLPFASVLDSLPTAVLASMLIVAVVPLVRVRAAYELFRISRPQFLITATTFVLTLLLSPHVERAVVAGVALSVAVHLWRELRLDVESTCVGHELHMRPQGVLWFGTARILEDRFLDLLAQHPDARSLRIHLRGLGRIDVTGALALKRVMANARRAGLTVELGLAPPTSRDVLRRVLRRDLE